MISAILTKSDIFRAERLFSERVSNPISTSSFFKPTQIQSDNDQDPVVFNKFISRLLKDTKKYRVVDL
jgi:hypothetical protein